MRDWLSPNQWAMLALEELLNILLRTPLVACATIAALAGCGSSDQPGDTVTSPGGQTNASPAAGTSTNWSGYAKTGTVGTFNQVKATWTVPTVDCAGGISTTSSTWAGIGGFAAGDQSLIQAGTEQDCNGGAAYYAWWEVFPLPSNTASAGPLSSQAYPVYPGDQIVMAIDDSAGPMWTIVIHNISSGWTFTTSTPFAGLARSAEWIEESPLTASTNGAGQYPMSNFGRMPFSALTANGVNPVLMPNERVKLVDSSGQIIANPSLPKGSGDSFDICYGASSCP